MMPINYLSRGLVSLLLANCLCAQNPNLEFRNSIVAYNLTTVVVENSRWTSLNNTFNRNFSTTNVELIHPVVAYRWRTKRVNFQEVELTRLSVGSTDTKMQGDYVSHSFVMFAGSQVVTTDIEARYEFIFTFNKKKETRLVPAVGFGTKSYFKRSDASYYEPVGYFYSHQAIGFEAQVVPRLSYFFGKRMFLDLNVPVSLFYQEYNIRNTDNPAMPVQYRRLGWFSFGTIPAVFSLRSGVGVRF